MRAIAMGALTMHCNGYTFQCIQVISMSSFCSYLLHCSCSCLPLYSGTCGLTLGRCHHLVKLRIVWGSWMLSSDAARKLRRRHMLHGPALQKSLVYWRSS